MSFYLCLCVRVCVFVCESVCVCNVCVCVSVRDCMCAWLYCECVFLSMSTCSVPVVGQGHALTLSGWLRPRYLPVFRGSRKKKQWSAIVVLPCTIFKVKKNSKRKFIATR